jgi:hypothetical protein
MVRLLALTLGTLVLLTVAVGCDKRIREADGSRHAPPLKTANA